MCKKTGMVLHSFLYRTQTQYTDLAFTAQNYGWQGTVMQKHFNNLSKGRIKKWEILYSNIVYVVYFSFALHNLRLKIMRSGPQTCITCFLCASAPNKTHVHIKTSAQRCTWSDFLLIYFLFRYINWHIVVLIAFEYMQRLKMLHMHNSLTCNSLTCCFLSGACHFEKIKP